MTDVTGFLVVAPSCVGVNEPFSLKIKALTAPYHVDWRCYTMIPRLAGPFNLSPRGIAYMDNVPPDWNGQVTIEAGDYQGASELIFDGKQGAFPGDKRPIGIVEDCRFTDPGVKFITVRDPESGVESKSNAIVVTSESPSKRIFWGDIHSQTIFSDGLRCPEELYSFARDEAFLDIFALADHSESLTDDQWDYFTATTNRFNHDHHFVTLVGQEWTSHNFGHRNIYYPGDSGPILRCSDPVDGQLERVYKVAREHGALVIPHHSANVVMGVNWSLGHDPEVERLCEIHSVWGNSERPADAGNPYPIRTMRGEKTGQHVVDALKRGRRFGFIGGGDIHDGRPGDELHSLQETPEEYRLLWRQGIMGVWTADLTRQSVFEALWNRRVFGATNARIFLEFSVCGAPMGSQIETAGNRPIHIRAVSESPITTIDIVRDGEDWNSMKFDRQDVDWEIEDTDAVSPAWYYARVTCANGGMAWSSPVWVDR